MRKKSSDKVSELLRVGLCLGSLFLTSCTNQQATSKPSSILVVGFGQHTNIEVGADMTIPLPQLLKRFQPIPGEINFVAIKRGAGAPYEVPITVATNAASPPGGTPFLVRAGDTVAFTHVFSPQSP